MHTTVIRSAQSLGNLDARTPSHRRSPLRSLLARSWFRKNGAAKPGSLHRLEDRPLADAGLNSGHAIHDSQDRTERQRRSRLPPAVLAIWMPSV